MKRATLRFGKGFKVLIGNRRSQAASMTLAPGDAEGGPDNRHRGADQWLFVESGTGRTPLKTLSIYVPPAYTRAGEELPRERK